MKKIFLMLLPVILMTGSAHAGSDPAPKVTLSVASDTGKTQCAAQPGKGITLVWNGVKDLRTDKNIGTLKTRKEEVDVGVSGTLEESFGNAVKIVLQNCGFTVVAKGDGIKTSAEITELFAGAKKGFFTGETDAKGAFDLKFMSNLSSYDANFGATRSDKRLKKKDVKQLEMVLNGLVESLVVQIAESPTLFNEVRKLAGK